MKNKILLLSTLLIFMVCTGIYSIAGEGNETVEGNTQNNEINTGSGDDNIHGNQGDDVINSGAGDDLVSGGPGNVSRFYFLTMPSWNTANQKVF